MPYTLNKPLAVLFVLSLLISLVFNSSTPGIATTPRLQTSAFTPAKCMFTVPSNAAEGVDITCGYLAVPAEHAKPDGPTLSLAVAIIKSRAPNVKTDPVVFAQGGPGGSTIDTYVGPLLSNQSRLRADRDIILFDQRGTLYSQPSLYCKEYDKLVLDSLEKDVSPDESERLDIQMMQTCHDRLVQENINLSDFNSIENARDIDDLRQALGYEKINLYGVSYGTLLALEYMRLFPNSLRSVILDGVVPPQINIMLDNVVNEDHAFTQLFTACARDADCDRSYPNLEQVYTDLIDKLEKTPARIPMTDPASNITYNAVIDGESFQSGIFQMLYVSSLLPALPRMIYNAKNGEFSAFGRLLSIFVFDRTMSLGMYYSVWCAEDADFNPQDVKMDGVRPQIAEFEKRSPDEFLTICKNWGVKDLGQQVDQPVISDVPTLLLSGAFDPVTPVSNAEAVAAGLSHSFSLVFPTGAHGQALENECSDGVILSFLNDPTTKPDDSCINTYRLVEFYTNNNLVPLPMLLKLLNLGGSSGYEALTLFISTLLLSTALLILPLAWLVNRMRRNPQAAAAQPTLGGELPGTLDPFTEKSGRPPMLVSISSWVAVLAALTLVVFLGVLTFYVFQMAFNNDNRLLFGVTHAARTWFVLPIMTGVFTLEMIGATLQGWLWQGWSIGRRFYYTFITLAAIVCMVILAMWGILTALF